MYRNSLKLQHQKTLKKSELLNWQEGTIDWLYDKIADQNNSDSENISVYFG